MVKNMQCTQRICEYRARIARDVMTAVENHLDDVCGSNAPSAVQEIVEHLLEKKYARHMWRMLQPTSTPPLFLYLLLFISVYLGHSPSGPYSLSVPTHSYCCAPITLLFPFSIVLYT
ncbi:hypothetical protein JOM56_008980 [Amanita muscaria]